MIDARPSIASKPETSAIKAACAPGSRVSSCHSALNHTSFPRRHHAATCRRASARPRNRTKYAYNEIGNITSKSDVGTYTYPATGKVHAVTNAGGVVYSYDANGNMLTAGPKTFTWTSFNMPATIQIGALNWNWQYDADKNRVKHVSPADTTVYLGIGNHLVYERALIVGVTHHRHVVRAEERVVAQFTLRSAGAPDTRFLYQDRLGSNALLGSEVGVVTERLAYDAQGKRRFPSGADDTANSLAGQASERGFTGHEHIDELGLIHMNGRLLDARVGRFASADSEWSESDLPQSWNRYSHVLNNPLEFTDPTGYWPIRNTLVKPVSPGLDGAAPGSEGRPPANEDGTPPRIDSIVAIGQRPLDLGGWDRLFIRNLMSGYVAGSSGGGSRGGTTPNRPLSEHACQVQRNCPPQPPKPPLCFGDSRDVAMIAGGVGFAMGFYVGVRYPYGFANAVGHIRHSGEVVDILTLSHEALAPVQLGMAGASALGGLAAFINGELRQRNPCKY